MASSRYPTPSRFARACFLFLFFWLLSPAGFCAKPKFSWNAPTKEELAESSAQVEPGAAAEILLNRVEIDDGSDGSVRKYHTYQRYKIYDPARASSILSLSYWESAAKDTSLTIEARLLLPSGETKEFNQSSFLERTIENKSERGGVLKMLASSKEGLTQKYLPIAGVERGAVLEIQMSWEKKGDDIPPMDVWLMQFEEVAVRKSDYTHRCQRNGPVAKIFTLNGVAPQVTYEDKRQVVKASASNLPAIHAEPLSGPLADYSELTVIAVNYVRRFIAPRMDAEDLKKKRVLGREIQAFGPWLPWAATLGYFAEEYGRPSARIKKLAAEICAGAETDQEKSRRIHNYVLRLNTKYSRHTEQKKLKKARLEPTRLNDVLDFEKLKYVLSPEDFLLLTYSLNKAAGLDAYIVALPDRTFMRFSPRMDSERLLQDFAIGIFKDGRWSFSAPHISIPLPFDLLPPPNLGQTALVGQGGQEFITVPVPPPDTTVVSQSGEFQMDAQGNLTGTGMVSLTGYAAAMTRYILKDLDEAMQKKTLQEIFLSDLSPSAAITVSEVKNLDGIDDPLLVTFSLNWEGFATKSDDRLILKTSIFHAAQRSPFTVGTRRTPIVFDFKWRELDHVVLRLPDQFALEAPHPPKHYPHEIFNYGVTIKYAPKSHRLILDRNYSVDCVEAKRAAYPEVRDIHARIQNSDEHEIVLKLKPAATQEPVSASSASIH